MSNRPEPMGWLKARVLWHMFWITKDGKRIRWCAWGFGSLLVDQAKPARLLDDLPPLGERMCEDCLYLESSWWLNALDVLPKGVGVVREGRRSWLAPAGAPNAFTSWRVRARQLDERA